MDDIQQMKHEIQEIQTRILELLHDHPGGQAVENEEYQRLRARLTELQTMVQKYEIEQVFGYYSYPLHYCRCPVPEIDAGNRQHPPRCLCCGRAVHAARVSDEPEAEFDYKREMLTFIAFILVIALLAFIYLTGGWGW